MMLKKVVIADDEPITRMDLSELLQQHSYEVVGSVSTGMDAIEVCKKHHPELVLMDVKMPLLDGIKASEVINKEGLADCVVLLTAYSNPEFVSRAIAAGVTGYIVKPLDEHTLIPTIEIALAKQKELAGCHHEITKLNNKMKDRIIVEQAKGILCDQLHYSEQEAYSYIRKLAMDKGYTIGTIAQAIVLNHE